MRILIPIKSEEMDWTCDSCDIDFKLPNQYINHISIYHSQSNSFKCGDKKCLRNYKSMSSLRSHILRKHNESSVEPPGKKQKLNNAAEVTNENECIDNFNLSTSHDVFPHKAGRNILESVPSTSQYVPSGNFSVSQASYINFMAKIYSYPDISRHRALEIINNVRDLVNNVFNENNLTISNTLDMELHHIDARVKQKCMTQVGTITHENYSVLQDLNTEHLIFNELERSKNLIRPQLFLLGERPDYRRRKEITEMKMIPVKAQFIPIRFVFRKLFELPSLLIETLN